jgi:membrane protease YdiL (CAAX protease family)
MRSLVARHPLASFFVLAYAIAWALWIPAVLTWKLSFTPTETPWWLMAAGVLGAYAPTVSALVVTRVVGGVAAVRALLRKFLIWRVGARWYLVVLLVPPAALVVALGIYASSGHTLGRFDASQWPLVLALPLLVLPFGSLGEELGWRGFALPALQTRHSALAGGVILGTLWALWHAPAYWAPSGTLISGEPVRPAWVAFYVVFTIGMCILINWVCTNTGGSVLMAVLMHTMMNAGVLLPLFPDLSDGAITAIAKLNIFPMWALVALILLGFGGRRLTREQRPEVRSGAVAPVAESGRPVMRTRSERRTPPPACGRATQSWSGCA